MKSINEAKLIEAGDSYAAANTPLFLLRRLHSDPEIAELGLTFSAEQLLEALRAAAAVEPQTPQDAVRPYALLTALWHKDRSEPLKEAATIEASYSDWYKYLSSVLLETFSPINSSQIQLPGYLGTDVSLKQSAPSNQIVIPVG
jgi:hypothetical protein